ncbi:MAG TPA: hypothetical protein VMT96_00490 [Candidatus Bathyarchaeia archaeon]|nr:hypothetical protein [Candidatus Bathyarchaeia archaeon]
MSVSDEAYFEKFTAFTAKLYPLFNGDPDSHKLSVVMNGMKHAPEHVREYLTSYAHLLEAQKSLDDRIDRAQDLIAAIGLPSNYASERSAERRHWCDAAWELISVWDDLVATCGGEDVVAHKVQTVSFFKGQLVKRA